MAKRFTDSTKWTNNKWFFELSVESKLFWIYLLDSCDQVGVWEENVLLASRIIGYEYSMDTLIKDLSKQIHVFKDGRKWWIVDFCRFQYGEMKEDSTSKPIQSHINLLKQHELWKEYLKGFHTLKDKDKVKEEVKVEEKGGMGGKCLMKNSGVSIENIIEAFNKTDDLKKANPKHYFQAAYDWSESKGEMRKDWIATVRSFARKDIAAGKLNIKSSASNGGTNKSDPFPKDIGIRGPNDVQMPASFKKAMGNIGKE